MIRNFETLRKTESKYMFSTKGQIIRLAFLNQKLQYRDRIDQTSYSTLYNKKRTANARYKNKKRQIGYLNVVDGENCQLTADPHVISWYNISLE